MLYRCFVFVFFFFHLQLLLLRTSLALPSCSNSDLGPDSGRALLPTHSLLRTTVRAFIFTEKLIQHYFPHRLASNIIAISLKKYLHLFYLFSKDSLTRRSRAPNPLCGPLSRWSHCSNPPSGPLARRSRSPKTLCLAVPSCYGPLTHYKTIEPRCRGHRTFMRYGAGFKTNEFVEQNLGAATAERSPHGQPGNIRIAA